MEDNINQSYGVIFDSKKINKGFEAKNTFIVITYLCKDSFFLSSKIQPFNFLIQQYE